MVHMANAVPPRSPTPAVPESSAGLAPRLRMSRLVPIALRAPFVSAPALRVGQLINNVRPKPHFAGRVALVAHVFYLDLLGEVVAAYENLPDGSHLIVTTPRDEVAAVSRALCAKQSATVIGVDNRGRDVAPFLMLLGTGHLDAYDAVLKLHTKRSRHAHTGNLFRKCLFQTLAGSRSRVAAILARFADDTTGMISWPGAWRNKPDYWAANQTRVSELLRRMDIAPPSDPAFFEGTMFWLRPRAIDRLRALDIGTGEFEAEAEQIDGALHHAVERVFAPTVAAAGFAVRDPSGRLLLPRS